MFWKVVFPLMKPVNATQLVLNTLFVWNDYTTAIILLRKPFARTLILAQMAYFNEYTSDLNLAFAFFYPGDITDPDRIFQYAEVCGRWYNDGSSKRVMTG